MNYGAIGELAIGQEPGGGGIRPSSVLSAESFGEFFVYEEGTFLVRGATSTMAFGASSVQPVLQPAGIVSAEAFGIPLKPPHVYAIGIVSGEAFGTNTGAGERKLYTPLSRPY